MVKQIEYDPRALVHIVVLVERSIEHGGGSYASNEKHVASATSSKTKFQKERAMGSNLVTYIKTRPYPKAR